MKIIVNFLISFFLLAGPACVQKKDMESKERKKESTKLFPIRQNNKFGFINRYGKIVIIPQFEIVGRFSEGLAWVIQSWETGTRGYIDTTGKVVVTPQFYSCRDFSDGFSAVWIDRKWGYIDKTGKFIIEPQFVSAADFAEGIARV